MTKILGLILSTLLVAVVYGQQDTTYCDVNTIPADPKNLPLPNTGDNKMRYQATIERNAVAEELTEEINEYYDGTANIGIALSDENGLRTMTYCNYRTNELFLIKGEQCVVLPLNTSIALTPFAVVVDGNGKEQIATPLNYFLSLPNVKFVYTGNLERVRGIPVNQWKTCLYNPQDKSTMKITLSYSDPEKWIPAIGVLNNQTYTVPVETLIEKKTPDGKETREVLSVIKYKAGLTLEEEDYYTPAGLYCAGRINTKPLPKIPESFSFRATIVEPLPKTYDLFGSITNIREVYDFRKNMFRIDYNLKGLPTHEVHDFNTGLRYLITLYRYNCSISALGSGLDSQSDGVNYRIRNPKEFFDLEGVPVQYVGQRRVSGVNTDVWIGPKTLDGVQVIMEWHFLTDHWISQESFGVNTNELALINIYSKASIINDKNQTELVDVVKRYQIFHFDSKRTDEFDFDISACYDQIGTRQVLFKFPASDAARIMANEFGFIRGVESGVEKVTGVTRARISGLEPFIDMVDGVYVTFRLLERPKFYGPVNGTKDDVTLADAIKKLKKSVTDGKFTIDVRIFTSTGPSTETFAVTAEADSYIEDDSKVGLISNKPRVSNTGYSGGAVAATTIIVTLVGITLGFLLIILHKAKKINLPFLRLFHSD